MRQLFGGLLLGCGILIAGLSGLCLTMWIGSSVFSPGSTGGNGPGDMLPLVLMFGVPPLLVGVGIIFAGRAVLRPPNDSEPPLQGAPAPLNPETMAHPDPERERPE